MSTKVNIWEGEIPSDLKHGDEVYLDFGYSGRIDDCIISKVAFTASQVWVDVIVKSNVMEVRLHNINAAYVFPRFESDQFLRRPLLLSGKRWNGDNQEEITAFAGDAAMFHNSIGSAASGANHPQVYSKLIVLTAEGEMECNVGDYLMKGVAGEFYPVKPEIFREIYRKV